MGDLLDWLLGELKDLLLWLPKEIWSYLVEALIDAFEALPVPDFLSQVPALFGAIPPGVWWFASVAQFGPGLGMVITALIARFLLRRIPVIG